MTNRTQFAIEENIDSMTDREIGAWILAETIKQKEIDLNLRSINIQFAEHVRRNLSFAEANFCAGEDVILEKIFRLLGNDESEKAGYLFRNHLLESAKNSASMRIALEEISKVNVMNPDANRGRKVLDSAKEGHKTVYGTGLHPIH